jgi:hypothetical protein
MLQDLAALAAPFIICVAFLVGVGAVLRSEMAPRRRRARVAGQEGARPNSSDPDPRSSLVAPAGEEGGRQLGIAILAIRAVSQVSGPIPRRECLVTLRCRRQFRVPSPVLSSWYVTTEKSARTSTAEAQNLPQRIVQGKKLGICLATK